MLMLMLLMIGCTESLRSSLKQYHAVRSNIPAARSDHLPLCRSPAESGNALMSVLVSVRGAVICLVGSSRCNGVDVFGLGTAVVDNDTTATARIGHAVARCAEVKDLENIS
jgi:hypothetical protein